VKECQLPVTAPLRATRSRRRKLSTSAIVIIVLAVLVSLAWSYFMPAVPESDAAADGSASDSFEALDALPVKGKSPLTSYDREAKFGTAWTDVDDNGCDTRNDILQRDLTSIVTEGDCKVMTGVLVSPYTRETISFVRGNDTSAEVQIDHIVALANAWQTGASKLSQDERVALANDPLNLFAVDGRSNSQKGAGDAATWLPASRTFRCVYVEHQIAVKEKYELWVTPAEHDAIERILEGCAQ